MQPFTFSSMTVTAVVAVTLLAGCAHRAGGDAKEGPMMGSGTGAMHRMGTMPMHDECSAEMQAKHQRMADPDARPRTDCPMKTP